MTKEKLIRAILEASKIHHNISTLSITLPDAPEDAPDNLFWDTCGRMVDMFKKYWEDWQNNPINDTGNRNIGKDCEIKGRIWTTGRSGATLYWDAYWNEKGFIYQEYDLQEKEIEELEDMLKDIDAFNEAVKGLRKSLPEELEYSYSEWKEMHEEAMRRQALGYNKTLEELLNSKNETVKRHAKGILHALQK